MQTEMIKLMELRKEMLSGTNEFSPARRFVIELKILSGIFPGIVNSTDNMAKVLGLAYHSNQTTTLGFKTLVMGLLELYTIDDENTFKLAVEELRFKLSTMLEIGTLGNPSALNRHEVIKACGNRQVHIGTLLDKLLLRESFKPIVDTICDIYIVFNLNH